MDTKVFARVRKILESLDAAGPSDDERLTMTEHLELLAAQGTGLEHLSANGRAIWTGTTAAIAAVVAVPTTAHMLALYNTEPDGGRSIIIDWVAAQNVVSTAVASQAQLLGLIGQLREAAPTDAALTFKKMNGLGGGAIDAPVRTILNATALPAATGVAANWFPVGPSVGKPGAATTPGYGLFYEPRGRFIIPPGRYWAQHVLANVVGETFVTFVGFRVKQITLA